MSSLVLLPCHCWPPYSYARKLQGQWRQFTTLLDGGQLIFLRDSSQDFLVDSGSSCSILQHQSTAAPSVPLLHTAEGMPLLTWGICTILVCVGTHSLSFLFLLAPVSLPILGADFLAAHQLLVDARRCQVLLHSSHQLVLPTTTRDSSPLLACLQA